MSHAERLDREGIITVTFTRDDKLNAVDDEMLDVLSGAVDDLGDDEQHRLLLITANGRYFTSGRDIAGLMGQPTTGVALRRSYRRLHRIFDEIEAIEKPVVVAAQGPCLGIGVELSASCDFRFAAESARFGLPEIPNLAVIPGSGGISRLTRVIGPHWSRWIAMASETISAEDANRMGFVHRVIPDEGFADAVLAWCQNLILSSGEALGLAKMAIDAAVDADRLTARNIDRLANTDLLHSAEHIAKIDQFMKRSGG
jgi:enoyl-CoA hydratase/carnithine racemase